MKLILPAVPIWVYISAVHIPAGCGKQCSSYPFKVTVPCPPSGDLTARWQASSLPPVGSVVPPSSLHHLWHSMSRHFCMVAHQKTTRSLLAGSDSCWLSTLKQFSDQGQPALSQAAVSRPDHLCTLDDTPGILQGYWESEEEAPWFRNGSQMPREPAETRGWHANKWANCKHQPVYKHPAVLE